MLGSTGLSRMFQKRKGGEFLRHFLGVLKGLRCITGVQGNFRVFQGASGGGISGCFRGFPGGDTGAFSEVNECFMCVTEGPKGYQGAFECMSGSFRLFSRGSSGVFGDF